MRSIFWLVIGLVLGVAGTGLSQLGWIVPPYPDLGHRLYGVKNETAAAVVLHALRATGGPGAKMAFDAGPTHQVVLDDGQRTVIGWFDAELSHIPTNGMSIAVADPRQAAEDAATILKAGGFTAEITAVKAGTATLQIIKSDALLGSALVYRRSWFLLDNPTSRPMPRIQ